VGEDRSGHPSTERVSVPQAADHLGTTVDAIRKRVQRGTIPYEKDATGRVWVLLDTGRPRQDATEHRQDTDRSQSDSTALISRLEDEVRFLREELARKDVILLRMAESIPQLEAPRESPVSPGPSDMPTDATDADRSPQAAADERQVAALRRRWADTPDAGGGPQSGSERRWWRRMFGG